MLKTKPAPSYALTLNQSRPLRYGVFFYLYVMQGIPAGFSLTALTNYFTAEGVKPALIGTFTALVGLPWAFQFVWGTLIDRYQGSPMGRRKPWVLGAQLLAFVASLGLLTIPNPVAQIQTLGWLFFTHSVVASIQDASVDAMAITVIKDHERGRVNAFMRCGFLVGTGLGATVFAYLLRHYTFFTAALVQSLCLLVFMLITFVVRERPEDRLLPFTKRAAGATPTTNTPLDIPDSPGFRRLLLDLAKGILARRSLALFGSVVLGYLSVSLFMRAYNYHLIQKLGWADTSVSILTGTYGMLVATVVALLGGYLADWTGNRRFFTIGLALVATYLLGFNLIDSLWQQPAIAQTGLIALYFMDPLISVAAIPLLMAVCRPGVEGSQFTTYMAFINLSDIAGSYLTGHALGYVNAPTIGLVAGGLVSLSLFFVLRSQKPSS
ncbi:MFS transporter [Tellurirhabdus bombi]|uniref:MFS transporter n=1 Tax=Tellurirhabdus bombi TaxID=2907205 RepID=UPI001F3495F7|nr:MFS transporter [Tellurirhabdus bombi]